jgi:uncharacterized protein
MSDDQIRYDLLTQDALRGVIRTVLADAAVKGLPGNHHFFITFDTGAEGVRISARLKSSYPDEMTIVLQHQFWDLAVGEDDFEVGLAFNGIPERLHVPLRAVKAFFDPSVQFGLQFVVEAESSGKVDNAEAAAPQPEAAPDKLALISKESDVKPEPKKKKAKPSPIEDAAPVASTPVPVAAKDEPAQAGEVVRLDRFRKK